jgi:hypothetical protein
MPIDFPDSPTLNQEFTVNGITWKWNGTAWDIVSGGAGFRVSDSAPSSPALGDLWYESDSGEMFIYYDSQWVSPAVLSSVGTSAIGTTQLADSSVTTSKIANDAVTSEKLDLGFLYDSPSGDTTHIGGTGTGTNVVGLSITLTPGKWLITGNFDWSFSNSGIPYVNIITLSNNQALLPNNFYNASASTLRMGVTHTRYFEAAQNTNIGARIGSGFGDVNCTVAGSHSGLWAVKIG